MAAQKEGAKRRLTVTRPAAAGTTHKVKLRKLWLRNLLVLQRDVTVGGNECVEPGALLMEYWKDKIILFTLVVKDKIPSLLR